MYPLAQVVRVRPEKRGSAEIIPKEMMFDPPHLATRLRFRVCAGLL
jgi:hypothetical protein